MVCASFLVKNLLLPWQWGLKHFWDCLLDADLEAAALGWQFCSGCLTGARLCRHSICAGAVAWAGPASRDSWPVWRVPRRNWCSATVIRLPTGGGRLTVRRHSGGCRRDSLLRARLSAGAEMLHLARTAVLTWSGCLPADAHALNHMMDHSRECKKYDPQGNYVRRWLPALGRLPVEYIHTCVPCPPCHRTSAAPAQAEPALAA